MQIQYQDSAFVLVGYSSEEQEKILSIKQYVTGVEVHTALEMFNEYVERYITKNHKTTFSNVREHAKIISFRIEDETDS